MGMQAVDRESEWAIGDLVCRWQLECCHWNTGMYCTEVSLISQLLSNLIYLNAVTQHQYLICGPVHEQKSELIHKWQTKMVKFIRDTFHNRRESFSLTFCILQKSNCETNYSNMLTLSHHFKKLDRT